MIASSLFSPALSAPSERVTLTAAGLLPFQQPKYTVEFADAYSLRERSTVMRPTRLIWSAGGGEASADGASAVGAAGRSACSATGAAADSPEPGPLCVVAAADAPA